MKTRNEIYQGEGAQLLRFITTYHSLQYEQVLRLFSKNRESIKSLITSLVKQKRIIYDKENGLLCDSQESANNPDYGMIASFWVLLDFKTAIMYHTDGEFPVKLNFFSKDEWYEVLYKCFIISVTKKPQCHVETKEISIIPPEHEQIIKEIAMEPSPNKNERYLYRYGPAIVFLLNTGLRGGELLALGQSSIVPFLGRRGIKITHTLSRVKNREAGSKKKTKMILTPPKYPNSLRTIPLNKEAEFSLSCMMELYDKNRVFPDLILSTQNGVSPTIQNLANTLKKICKRAEIPEYNLHALRHTFATNLIRQTHNMGEIKEAAEIIGDNYEVIMRTYVHTDSERKVSLIDAMIA